MDKTINGENPFFPIPKGQGFSMKLPFFENFSAFLGSGNRKIPSVGLSIIHVTLIKLKAVQVYT